VKSFRCLKIQMLSIVAVFLAVATGLVAQNSQRLYLVTGLAFSDQPLMVPSSLYGVDEVGHMLVKLASLADTSEGSEFIIADHERRVVVIGSPSVVPKEVTILSMDSPNKPRTLGTALSEFRFHPQEAFFFDRPGRGVILALREANETKMLLRGIDLSSQDASKAQTELAWDDYRSVRTEGWWSPGDEPKSALRLIEQGGKLLINRGGVMVDMGIPVPESFSSELDQVFFLDVSNDEILVIDRQNERGQGLSGPVGVTRLSIYDKATKSWHTENFEGGGSSVRAFGAWVVVNQAETKIDISQPIVSRDVGEKQSPGRQLRQRVLNPEVRESEQISIDGIFSSSQQYFPGRIDIFDSRTKTKYKLNTGQGDSEVLLISGTTLYYRVNDSLYRARIGKDGVEDSVEVIRDSNIQLAHWAFFGP